MWRIVLIASLLVSTAAICTGETCEHDAEAESMKMALLQKRSGQGLSAQALVERKAEILKELASLDEELAVLQGRSDEPPPGGGGSNGGNFPGGSGGSGGNGGNFPGGNGGDSSGEQVVYLPYFGEHYVATDEGMQTGRFDGDLETCANQCSTKFHTDGHCNSFAWCYPGAAAGYPGGDTNGAPFCYLKDKKFGPSEQVRHDTWCTTYVPQEDAQRPEPAHGYVPYQGTHRVLVNEGTQTARLNGDLEWCAEQCETKLHGDGHCHSFAWCEPGAAPGFPGGDDSGTTPFCYLKDKTPAATEPTKYSSWCTTYVPA